MSQPADFPFIGDRPVAIDGRGWLFVLAGVAVAFAALLLLPFGGFPAGLVPTGLFLAIQLAALATVVGKHWTALFGPFGLKQIGQVAIFAVASLVASVIVGLAVTRLYGANPNPIAHEFQSLPASQLALSLIPTLPQLLGEELLAVLPFLAMLWFCTTRMGIAPGTAIAIALLLSSLLFGAAHLPTYGWNVPQSLGIIGTSRIIMTLAYIGTKNLWVSYGVHVVNDWSEFVFVWAANPAG